MGVSSKYPAGDLNRAHGPSADFSTSVSLETDFHPAIGIHDDRNGVPIVQGLVEGFLGLVNPFFLVLDFLAAPRVAQPVAGRSNSKGIDNGNVGHSRLPHYW